ncbi:hypothetical protein LEP1GSC132_4240 [Leptospira kirschneri str. 200803703]|nr:hypothetical protein LEP1GSC065_3449 [Leptospira kirschneri serovar Sokoine str. RM1]EMO68463.1 hypothetical protein LEP1GSC132_4240 [Leptospira kirschneri str. 200803703]
MIIVNFYYKTLDALTKSISKIYLRIIEIGILSKDKVFLK